MFQGKITLYELRFRNFDIESIFDSFHMMYVCHFTDICTLSKSFEIYWSNLIFCLHIFKLQFHFITHMISYYTEFQRYMNFSMWHVLSLSSGHSFPHWRSNIRDHWHRTAWAPYALLWWTWMWHVSAQKPRILSLEKWRREAYQWPCLHCQFAGLSTCTNLFEDKTGKD